MFVGTSLFTGAYPKQNRYAVGQIQRVRQADSQTAMVDSVWSSDGEGGKPYGKEDDSS